MMKTLAALLLLIGMIFSLVFVFVDGSELINSMAVGTSTVASAAEERTVNGTANDAVNEIANDIANKTVNDTANKSAQAQDAVDLPVTATDAVAAPVSAQASEVMSAIRLNGDTITVEGEGAAVSGTIVTITAAGVYDISGTLHNGQLVVDTQDEETVTLVLNGVDITDATSAPIYVRNAAQTMITLADGTENVVTDGDAYLHPNAEDDEPNAAIFSKDDLTINGNGSLIVNANYNNGIASKDDLQITAGNITVYAANDGIKGRDSIAILDGIIAVTAGGDGLQSNNDEDAEKGYVAVEGGVLAITAGADGIQAETVLAISGGDITITSGGGSSNTATDSAKGLKADVQLTVSGGLITVDAADDAIHANGSITIDGGEFRLATGDDGIHADGALLVNGGDLTVVGSYEGLEGNSIVINDGIVRITSSDDGVNVAGGTDSSGAVGPQQDSFSSGDRYLEINGGYIVVDSGGDSLDANGPGTMNGGVVILNTPAVVGGGNGLLDLDGSLTINSGLLVASGSYGMGVSISATSTQYSVLETLPAAQAAGTLLHIARADGAEVVTFAPLYDYQNLVLSSPDLENGESYRVYTGGSATGTVTDGLYVNGTYTPGSEISSFTVTATVTAENASMSGRRGRP